MLNQRRIRLFCSDLDGTLLGEPKATDEFVKTWESLGVQKPILVYSTGRLDADAKRMISLHGMPEPDFYITGVGTMIYDTKRGMMLDAFATILDRGWDLEMVNDLISKVPGIERQPDAQQHAWKSSWYWLDKTEAEIEGVRRLLKDAGLEAQVIYSTSQDLDVLPRAANKGNAITWLAQHSGVDLEDIVVAGDSGNDSSMFLLDGVKGIAPNNASPELLREIDGTDTYLAKKTCASGVVEGLKEYGVVRR